AVRVGIHAAERDRQRIHRSHRECLPRFALLSRGGAGADHDRRQRPGASFDLAVFWIGSGFGMSLPFVRILLDRVVGALVGLCVMVAAIPVLVLFLFVIIKGLPGILTPGFFTQSPHPQGVPGGGVLDAILSTLGLVALGS